MTKHTLISQSKGPLAVLGALVAGLICQSALAASSAVIFMYHRFGEAEYPSTNIKIEQFEAHISELTSGPYTVLPVAEIIAKLKAGQALPERTIGITIDDAYRSIYTEAWPRLKAAGLPFTVFISTAHVDHGSARYLNWDQIREMQSDGVEFGHHSVSHLHMPKALPGDIDQEIELANGRFAKELGAKPRLLAYPYGETTAAVKAAIKDKGFSAAFGQHSGVVSATGDTFYLPRFGMNETYGGIERFRLAANALALEIGEMTPADPLIGADNPPAIGFTVTDENLDLSRISCFLNHENQHAELTVLGPRVEIRARKPLPLGRTRLNCTAPTKQGRWRWFGHQFIRIE